MGFVTSIRFCPRFHFFFFVRSFVLFASHRVLVFFRFLLHILKKKTSIDRECMRSTAYCAIGNLQFRSIGISSARCTRAFTYLSVFVCAKRAQSDSNEFIIRATIFFLLLPLHHRPKSNEVRSFILLHSAHTQTRVENNCDWEYSTFHRILASNKCLTLAVAVSILNSVALKCTLPEFGSNEKKKKNTEK